MPITLSPLEIEGIGILTDLTLIDLKRDRQGHQRSNLMLPISIPFQ